jgi:hypothetical protein
MSQFLLQSIFYCNKGVVAIMYIYLLSSAGDMGVKSAAFLEDGYRFEQGRIKRRVYSGHASS